MNTDPKVDEYMNYIKKHPMFQPGGELDEGGFYNQPDGCIKYSFF